MWIYPPSPLHPLSSRVLEFHDSCSVGGSQSNACGNEVGNTSKPSGATSKLTEFSFVEVFFRYTPDRFLQKWPFEPRPTGVYMTDLHEWASPRWVESAPLSNGRAGVREKHGCRLFTHVEGVEKEKLGRGRLKSAGRSWCWTDLCR